MKEEISAFAAYSMKKLKSNKSKNSMGISIKSKHKFKKKNKFLQNNSEILKAISNEERNLKNKNKMGKPLFVNNSNFSKESISYDQTDNSTVNNTVLKNNKSDLENYDMKSLPKKMKLNTGFIKENKKKLQEKKVTKDNGFVIAPHEKSKKIKTEVKGIIENSKNKDDRNNKKKIEMNTECINDKIINKNKDSNAEETEKLIKKKKDNNMTIVKHYKKQKTEENILPVNCDSVKVGEEIFSWIINPISLTDFFNNNWEKKPLYVQHNAEDYFKSLCTLEDFKKALNVNDIYFTKNIDVTSYVNGQRYTENPTGKATLSVVWDLFNNGKSIRLLNPQSFIPNIWLLNATLQEFFQCFIGANIYLTPAGTQGFAPHYDDIEAFVLQLEGEKHWKLYNPRNSEEVLPRESSKNFHESEIGDPIFETVLKPGDLLYFPRGVIHQANCLPHIHSLHVTVSCYQKNTWADLFEKVFPVALQKAITEEVEFRKGLPLGYLSHFGMVNSDLKTQFRKDMINKFNELALRVLDFCPLDAGVDQLATGFIHDALPPYLTDDEKLRGGNTFDPKYSLKNLKNNLQKDVGIKLIRPNCIRLVSEGDELLLYYSTDNSLVYHENEIFSEEIPFDWGQAVECLIHAYPKYTPMNKLPFVTKEGKPKKWKHVAEFVYFLYQKRLLLFDAS